MSNVVRCSVSLEADLLEQFDRYCKEGLFETRSDAVRQLLREALTAHAWKTAAQHTIATLTLMYDHHRTHLSERMLELQHQNTNLIVSTMHVHLDHNNCVEVIILRGPASDLQRVASELRGMKGIQTGQLVLAGTSEAP